MLDWIGSILDGGLAVLILVAVALLFAILVPRLLRRLRALVRGEVEILLEPWTSLRIDADGQGAGDDDFAAGVGELFLFAMQRVQSIHARTVNRVEISNAYRDVPSFTEGLGSDIDLLASQELEGDVGRIAALTGVVLRLLPALTPRTRLRGSIRRFGNTRALDLTLEHFPVPRRPAYGSPTSRRRLVLATWGRLARVWQLCFGQRQTLTWEIRNEAATNADLTEDVEQAAYAVYLDLLGDDTFKSSTCFRLFTQGLEHHVRYMDLGRPEDLESARAHYRNALDLEPKNQVVSYNLGVVEYMTYASAETNRAAAELFHHAVSTPNPQLKARAHAGIANAETMAVDRFGEGGRATLDRARAHAEEAVALAPKLDASNKAYGYTHHKLAEWLERPDLPDGVPGRGGHAAAVRHHRRRAGKGYAAAIKANRGHYIAYNNLGNLYLGEATRLPRDNASRRRLLLRAKKALEHALAINAAFPFAHDNLGNVFLALDMLDDAYRSYDAAVRFDPDYPEARNDLAMLLLDAAFVKPVPDEDAHTHHRLAIEAARRKAPAGADRRVEKLCREFDARYRELQRRGRLRDGEWPGGPPEHHSCRALPATPGVESVPVRA